MFADEITCRLVARFQILSELLSELIPGNVLQFPCQRREGVKESRESEREGNAVCVCVCVCMCVCVYVCVCVCVFVCACEEGREREIIAELIPGNVLQFPCQRRVCVKESRESERERERQCMCVCVCVCVCVYVCVCVCVCVCV